MLLQEYLCQLQKAIQAAHGCAAAYHGAAFFPRGPDLTHAWQGAVEIFDLTGHPAATRCYAWGCEEQGNLQPVIVLHLPPVDNPEAAVRVALET
jgi:hypothetical protein